MSEDEPSYDGKSRASASMLESWLDGPTKSAIVDFVGRLTTDGPDYVTPEARVAVFDNDGTLWREKPMYVQLDFLLRRFAEQHRPIRHCATISLTKGPSRATCPG